MGGGPRATGEGRPGGRDRIEVRGLVVLGVHGVLAEERARAQPFSVDLDVWADSARAAASDDLGDAVDYATVVETAAAVVAGRSYSLLEALADAIAGAVLAGDERVAAVAVTVRKLRPPLALQIESVGVRLVRRRRPGPAEAPGAASG